MISFLNKSSTFRLQSSKIYHVYHAFIRFNNILNCRFSFKAINSFPSILKNKLKPNILSRSSSTTFNFSISRMSCSGALTSDPSSESLLSSLLDVLYLWAVPQKPKGVSLVTVCDILAALLLVTLHLTSPLLSLTQCSHLMKRYNQCRSRSRWIHAPAPLLIVLVVILIVVLLLVAWLVLDKAKRYITHNRCQSLIIQGWSLLVLNY